MTIVETRRETRTSVTNLGIKEAIDQLSKDKSNNGKMIVLVGDTDITYSADLVKEAKQKQISLFVLNVNPKETLVNCKKMAKETAGFYYEISDLKQVYDMLYEIKHIIVTGISTSDRDDDGIFDVYEEKGMRICNGKILKSNPDLADTDGDSATDLEEMGDVYWYVPSTINTRAVTIPANTKYYKLKTYVDREDSDMDGISDYVNRKRNDPLPKSNLQGGYLQNYKDGKREYQYSLNYEFDFRWFQDDNMRYNSRLRQTSSMLATLAYYNTRDSKAEQYKMANKANAEGQSIMEVLKKHGFLGVKEIYLGDKYKDNHIVQFNLGEKLLSYGKDGSAVSKPYYVVPVVIRGTKGQKEWFSNFDIGNTEDISKYPEWTTANNHKGFDITANRVVKEVKEYIKDHPMKKDNTVFWIMGHSRGGAVANLVSKKMGDLGYNTYTYTFATPNVTTDTGAETKKYGNIYNMVNEDDFIPELPLKKWGFQKYGFTFTYDMDEKQKEVFKKRTKITYKGAEPKVIAEIVKNFGNVSATRNGCYVYTCKCHSPNKTEVGKSIQTTIRGATRKEVIDKFNSYPNELKEYSKLTVLENNVVSYSGTVCQTPMYFMNQLATVMGGGLDKALSFWKSKKEPDRYRNAKTVIIDNRNLIQTPHFADTYIILSK